ncbi:ABC1 kinase family protein [Paenibacillus marinisediminis]
MKLRRLNRSSTRQNKDSSVSRVKEMLSVLRAHDIVHGLTPVKLRMILEELGPTFIKLGQMVSMRHDLLPPSYCDELARLRADVSPMGYPDVLSILQQEYGAPIREVFAHIEQEPLGSASIAQVHPATLKNGSKVVIKVQRPDIREKMAQDIALMKRTTRLLKFIGNTGDAIDFNTVLEEMWLVAQEEMNFLLEASNNREFTKLNEDVQYVRCPKIEKNLTTSRILVMEYINGIQIDQLDRLRELGYDINDIGMKLADNYVKQIVDDAFFHADPHPGNIWISEGKIVWLDLGMMGRLSNRDRTLLRNAVVAIANNDIHELKNVVITLGVVKGRIDHSRLYTDIDVMLTKYGSLDLSSLNLGQMLQDMIELSKQHGITMPQGITMLGRGIMTIEGLLRACCPEVNFVQIMANHLSGEAFSNFDLKEELRQGGKALYNFSKKTVELPSQLSELLKIVIKGQSKVNIELVGSEEPLKQVNSMVDKMVVCMITAALLVSSSLICLTDMKPKVLGIPLLGIIGFVNAFFPGGWLLYQVMFKNKKRKK